MTKIAIVGPESSGKSTLANELALKLPARLINEYSREYFENRDYNKCNLDDLISIAKVQFNNANINVEAEYLISDTEMITMEIWAKDKFNSVPKLILDLRNRQNFDLYILTKPDIPWEYDHLRTDSNRRNFIFQLYLEKLKSLNVKFIIVEGSVEYRVSAIMKQLL